MLFMIFSLIGASSSNKTTIAARVLGDLREASLSVEFVPETARTFIAKRRIHLSLNPKEPVNLTDEHHLEIMRSQLDYENLMVKACGDTTLVITDSSPLNSLLYFSDEVVEKDELMVKLLETIKKTLDRDVLYVYNPPTDFFPAKDPNRLFSKSEAKLLNEKVFTKIMPLLNKQPVVLSGNSIQRTQTATAEALKYIMGQ